MREVIMGYQGEMSLKGLNRNQFESTMMKILRYRLKTVGKFRVYCTQSTFYMEPEEDDIDMDALGVPETVTRVRVTKVIKGDAKVGDIIEVAQGGGVDKSGIVRRETSTTLLNEAKASGTAEFLLLLNEYDVVYNAINPISGVLGVDTDGHVTALKSSGESGGIGESLKEYMNAVS